VLYISGIGGIRVACNIILCLQIVQMTNSDGLWLAWLQGARLHYTAWYDKHAVGQCQSLDVFGGWWLAQLMCGRWCCYWRSRCGYLCWRRCSYVNQFAKRLLDGGSAMRHIISARVLHFAFSKVMLL
jgi:hypothetical protein